MKMTTFVVTLFNSVFFVLYSKKKFLSVIRIFITYYEWELTLSASLIVPSFMSLRLLVVCFVSKRLAIRWVSY